MPHQKSGHWQYFAALNDARPGAGFDVDYLRAGPIKAFITNVLMRLRGRDPNRHRNVFRELWPNGPITWRCVRRVGGSPVAYLAANYANTILETMPKIGIVNPDRAVFLEIGGGSGYLTHFLLHKLPHARAYIIDLPEVLELGRRNLERLGTADRVTFLTPDQGEQVSIFHIAMNTASFQEMPPSEIARYFDLMRSKRADSQSAFYCCNRVEKWLSDKIESSDTTESERGYAVRFMEYPWGTEQILFHRPSQMHGKLKMQPCLERMITF